MNNRDILADMEGEWLCADGFDNAIIGTHKDRVVYSVSKCIFELIKQGMTEDEAIEYFDYNVLGAYVGEKTPVFIEDRDFLSE